MISANLDRKIQVPRQHDDHHLNIPPLASKSLKTDHSPVQTPSTPNIPADLTKDIVSQVNGDFGYWQLRTILLVFLCKIPSAWFMACVIYTAPSPQKGEYYCKPTFLENATDSLTIEQTDWVKYQHPLVGGRRTDRQFQVDACNVYEKRLENDFAKTLNYSNPFEEPKSHIVKVIPCENFQHNTDYQSLVTQFDLVCSRQMLVSVSQCFHVFGNLVGGLIAYHVLKKISPRRLMMIGMLGQIFCGNLTGLVSSFVLHIFYRSATSAFCALMYTSGTIILGDITGGKVKTIVVTLFELFWSIGLILLPAISIFFDNWSYLYVAISSSVFLLVFLHRWIADSPRWLLRHNKIDKALKQMLESATYNQRMIPLDLEEELTNYAKHLQAKDTTTYISIWSGPTKIYYLLAVHWAWTGAAVLYNVMLIMIRSLGIEHIHVNTASMGFGEMVGVFLGLYFILYTRHRWLWTGYLMIFAGSITYFLWFIPTSLKENRRVGFSMIFWIFLKMANSASLSLLTTCTGELVSAEKRPFLMLSVTTFSRIILSVAPLISTLTVIHQLVPISIFAGLGIINGLLMILMNVHFWNFNHPGKQKVPSPNTFRRNSTIIMSRRGSVSSDNSLSSLPGMTRSISISDLWKLNSMEENENSLGKKKEQLELGHVNSP